MRRRQALRTIGAGIATLGVSSTASARGRDETPNGNVETTDVNIFAPEDDPVDVPAGNWVNHSWGWIDAGYGGDSTEEGIEAYLEAVEITIRIDGEEIADPDQYWGEPKQNDDGKWIVRWEHVTPPKSPGHHTFTLEAFFPDGFEDDGEVVREPGSREELTGHYEVTRGGGKGQ